LETLGIPQTQGIVIPAKAGIQPSGWHFLGPRLRGDDLIFYETGKSQQFMKDSTWQIAGWQVGESHHDQQPVTCQPET
jgi:hypothetical protein